MRVRVMRDPDPTSSQARLTVQRWAGGQWELVRSFELHESDQVNEFALKLSMTKRVPIEMAVFEDGEKLERRIGPLVMLPDCESSEKISENQT